jgi:membrane protein YdbS with pleckstrin-like domain
MQLVDVNRGPVARLLGLAELRLVTAAATSNITIPGLPEPVAAQVRDLLIDRAEERRVGL